VKQVALVSRMTPVIAIGTLVAGGQVLAKIDQRFASDAFDAFRTKLILCQRMLYIMQGDELKLFTCCCSTWVPSF
jgi:hypothetical protein